MGNFAKALTHDFGQKFEIISKVVFPQNSPRYIYLMTL